MSQLRTLLRPAPEPPLPDFPWVVNDLTGEALEIRQDEFADYQARGFRIAPPGTPAQRNGVDLAPVRATRDLWAREEMELYGGGQLNQWAAKRHKARLALNDAAEKLSVLIDRPFHAMHSEGTNHRDIELSPHYNLDLLHSAVTAEAVVLLADEVTALKAEVAALKAAQENAR